MAQFEVKQLTLSRDVPRSTVRRLLVEQAEVGHWELSRVRIYPDGTRRVWLRRRQIRVARTAWVNSS